ncbi:MAG: lipoate--protein ligase family protein [Candidatus Cloacimonetes bacterium]|nr:lipoate--protein ligase family protein [Candidatus Cloacimonadota bacterium]
MVWRILISKENNSAMNMAIDEAIFNHVQTGRSKPTIRFYQWDPATVSCGYNQEIKKEVDLEAIRELGFGFVRRPTGGRVVLHDHEVTYAVIAPCEGKFSGSVTESYSEISKALAVGFKLMGIEVDFEKGYLSSEHQRKAMNPCFTSSSRYELNYQHKKLVGSAQVRKYNCLLQHGSILLNYDQSKLAAVLPRLSPEQKGKLAKYLKKKTVSINAILNTPIEFHEAVDFFISGFQEKWNKDEFVISNKLDMWELESSEKLRVSKYLTDGWNRRKI